MATKSSEIGLCATLVWDCHVYGTSAGCSKSIPEDASLRNPQGLRQQRCDALERAASGNFFKT